MHFITDLEWDDDNIFHIARHRVRPEEVEEVCFSLGASFETGRGRNIYYVTGQTESGRYLFVVARYIGHGKARVITARDMDQKEKNRCRRKGK